VVAAQLGATLRALDAMLDAMLPDAVREHPVWSLRERFDEHVELDADSGLANHPANEPDGYPERVDAVAGPTPPLPDPDLTGAARRAPADERPGSDRGDLDGSDDMVQVVDGLLHVVAHGAQLTRRDDALVVRRRRGKQETTIPTASVSAILITGIRCSVSTTVVPFLSRNEVPLVLGSLVDQELGLLAAPTAGTAKLRVAHRARGWRASTMSTSLKCPKCGGPLRIIVMLAEPEPIRAILQSIGLP